MVVFLINRWFSRYLYKLAVYSKPLATRFVSQTTRQKIRRILIGGSVAPTSKSTALTSSYQYIDGINLVGYSRAEMGVGESCRAAANSLHCLEIPFGIINFTGSNSARSEDITWAHKEISKPEFSINIFHINAQEMKDVYTYYGSPLFGNRYNIGFWHWELPDFPDDWIDNFSFLDEVWVPSTFVGDSISIKSPIPVVKIPHSIEVKISEPRSREYFGLPDNSFLFLSMYDAKSYQERKNPKAAIKAFKMSFDPWDTSVGLVVKANNPSGNSNDIMEIRELVGDYQNIYIIDKTVSRNDVNALINVTDCFVSLHRSEGFGLVMAEAMYLGKPVIGTNWSSNTDFMNPSNSCLVDFQLISLNNDHGPYKAYQHWADPSILHASKYMTRLVSDKEYYNQIAINGEQYIKEHHSPEKIGRLIRKRMDYIKKFKFGG
ncbi:glycosyltransferase [Paenibacillus motobuensis]|uniref:glycosyltransferase n=1 Tax=Paenibacillus TaxID=44249 RepID=UPI002040D194|nr:MULTISPECIES: glycosyltransferase [Paenibacillus]MCM3040853.1 glycosyltransferase [Paenibacillus lutimineralis]MCM3647957.1 glycosyltransferase [Paenibacillus motobuensis]